MVLVGPHQVSGLADAGVRSPLIAALAAAALYLPFLGNPPIFDDRVFFFSTAAGF